VENDYVTLQQVGDGDGGGMTASVSCEKEDSLTPLTDGRGPSRAGWQHRWPAAESVQDGESLLRGPGPAVRAHRSGVIIIRTTSTESCGQHQPTDRPPAASDAPNIDIENTAVFQMTTFYTLPSLQLYCTLVQCQE